MLWDSEVGICPGKYKIFKHAQDLAHTKSEMFVSGYKCDLVHFSVQCGVVPQYPRVNLRMLLWDSEIAVYPGATALLRPGWECSNSSARRPNPCPGATALARPGWEFPNAAPQRKPLDPRRGGGLTHPLS